MAPLILDEHELLPQTVVVSWESARSLVFYESVKLLQQIHQELRTLAEVYSQLGPDLHCRHYHCHIHLINPLYHTI